jgi:hypothetical protein
MCQLCVNETGITDLFKAHDYVGIISRSFRLGFANPFMVGGCVCVMTVDGILRLNTWAGLDAMLVSFEED